MRMTDIGSHSHLPLVVPQLPGASTGSVLQAAVPVQQNPRGKQEPQGKQSLHQAACPEPCSHSLEIKRSISIWLGKHRASPPPHDAAGGPKPSHSISK